MYFGSFAQSILDNTALLDARRIPSLDRCPLGPGASYGTGQPLDRAWTFGKRPVSREHLGLSMSEANGRGKIETATLDALSGIINDLSRFAGDMVFFTSAECSFFRIGAGLYHRLQHYAAEEEFQIYLNYYACRSARFLGLRTGS